MIAEWFVKVSIVIDDERRADAGGDSVIGFVPSLFKPKSVIKSTLVMPTGQTVFVVKGDLTDYKVDVIVNAANETMAHVGGIANAIVDKGEHVLHVHYSGPMITENAHVLYMHTYM